MKNASVVELIDCRTVIFCKDCLIGYRLGSGNTYPAYFVDGRSIQNLLKHVNIDKASDKNSGINLDINIFEKYDDTSKEAFSIQADVLSSYLLELSVIWSEGSAADHFTYSGKFIVYWE